MTGTEGLVSCSFRFVPCFAFAVCLFAVFFILCVFPPYLLFVATCVFRFLSTYWFATGV